MNISKKIFRRSGKHWIDKADHILLRPSTFGVHYSAFYILHSLFFILSGKREDIPGVIGEYRPETVSRFPPPATYVNILILKVQRHNVIGVDMVRAFFPIDNTGIDQHIDAAGQQPDFLDFQWFGCPVSKMNAEIQKNLSLAVDISFMMW